MSLPPRLRAVSDLHVGHPLNRAFVQELRPDNDGDWLLVAGDVADRFADIEWALALLSSRFARVVWAPGNHELWTPPNDRVTLRGEERYRELVRMCRRLGVLTPEDPYPVWDGDGGPATIAPLFVLYDYTFRVPQARTQQESLALAYAAGVVCTDEMLLHPDPHPSREAWCAARIVETERRLAERDLALPTVLVNHYPLVREPTDVLRYPLFAQWCGTVRTSDWHLRFDAATVVYGHLHIPRTTFHDGVRFEEVSLGYPREWQRRGPVPDPVRTIHPADDLRRRSSVSG
ncbi:metallophosphoesterase [Micromonospora sp. C97]|uniref:metallophosphoesterase family protein n=1 Tax=Micromonospora sp. C97 TaxID=2824883 RepID=UPI001B38FCB5|nr:metallophosphoesterase [Micromonospora sp. C97]MBQ1032418.1 metallophosphoesterase [Micromonospora sp. C97]